MLNKSSPNISLIGFPTSGKTILGGRLAQHLNKRFIDVDALIQSYHASLSCREIFQVFGEAYFRYLESKAIQSLEAHPEPVIIATGGGSLIQEKNCLSLKKHSRFIYLKVPSVVLKERLLCQSALPAFLQTEDPEHAFNRLYGERSVLYEKWADHIIDLHSFSVEQCLQELNRLLLEV
ncbi:shikimate kinase [Candidatus Protochlamydia phocaeensis]|uniref:shikimate kinase n=1 Tax=Candidatus Protochlamydia phocaeensis TaxID=1414722 RepID=UPI00083995E8|nr:shikimate kinase [Candidatus Protochlamydia phocaeensis]